MERKNLAERPEFKLPEPEPFQGNKTKEVVCCEDRLHLKARKFVENLVKREARNFYFGFMLLPSHKRQAVFALYAFCRLLDDAVDNAPAKDLSEKGIRRRFSKILNNSCDLTSEDRLVAISLSHARKRFPIKEKQLNWIIDGVLMDLSFERYKTFQDLRRYLFGVASSVGLACMEIFGYRSLLARKYAVYLGYAMQLTNIIRDVKEDFLRGRIYIPQEDLKHFNVGEAELGANKASENLRKCLAFTAARARGFFRKADPLWHAVSRDAAACPFALAGIYELLLKQIERSGFEVLSRRHSVPVWKKLLVAACAALRFRL